MRPTGNEVKTEPTAYGGLFGTATPYLEIPRISTGVFSPALFFVRPKHESITKTPPQRSLQTGAIIELIQ